MQEMQEGEMGISTSGNGNMWLEKPHGNRGVYGRPLFALFGLI